MASRLSRKHLLLLMISLIGLIQAVQAAEYQVYFLGGQSNMNGFGLVEELPYELLSPMSGAWIFQGNPAEDGVSVDGRGLWALVQPGHGVGFHSDGKKNHYSLRFGVELGFVRRLKELEPDARIALIKYAKGGSSIDQRAAGRFGSWDPDFQGGTGEGSGVNQYDHFLATLRNAFSICDIDRDGEPDRLIPAGILWMQGESDAAHTVAIAREYERNLSRLVELIRAALRSDDLPVVLGRITDSGQDEEDGRVWDHAWTVRKAQEAFARKDRSARLITTTDDYFYSDPWHYDSYGFLDLGEKFAEAIHKIRDPG